MFRCRLPVRSCQALSRRVTSHQSKGVLTAVKFAGGDWVPLTDRPSIAIDQYVYHRCFSRFTFTFDDMISYSRYHRVPIYWTYGPGRVKTTKANLDPTMSNRTLKYRFQPRTSDPLSLSLVKCTEKILDESFFSARRFSKKVGLPDWAMLPKASPRSPLLGSSLRSSDTL